MPALICNRARTLLGASALLLVLTSTPAAFAGGVIFTEDTVIECNDLTFDGLDVTVDGAVLTVTCTHDFASLAVINGGTVTHEAGNPEGLDLRVAGNVFVEEGAAISASGRGLGPGDGPGAGESCKGKGCGGGGGAHGGRGGAGVEQAGGAGYGSVDDPVTLGSGGGGSGEASGGAGGGAIRLTVVGTLDLGGALLANGVDADNTDTGGGAGGSLFVAAAALTGGGVVEASGGAGSERGGGGGGGRMALLIDDFGSETGPFAAVGGAAGEAGAQAGGAGTVYLREAGNSRGDLRLDNGGQTGATTDLSGGLVLENASVTAGAILSHAAGESGFHLSVANDLTIGPEGRASAAGRGFAKSEGPGAGDDDELAGGGGGGYGGRGGNGGGGATGGSTYGSDEMPTDLGSGGGSGGPEPAGAGGGALRITVGGTLAVAGAVDANGAAGNGLTGGGSGGSLFIEATNLAGDGPIQANGGRAALNAGGGGGGRVAVYTDSSSYTGEIRAQGAVGFFSGESGTIVLGALRGELDFEDPVQVAMVPDPSAVGAIDFDQQNGDDVAVPSRGGAADAPGQVVVLLNDGSGVGFERVLTDVGDDPSAVAWGEFDGINGPDLAVANAGDDTVSILLNDGLQQGTFVEPAQVVAVGDLPSAIQKGFINGDESLDLAVANKGDNTVSILLNDGNGVFAVVATIPVGSLPAAVEFGDFGLGASSANADDIAIALEGDDEVLLLQNDGDGNYIECCEIPVGAAPLALPPEDLDNDKDLDLAVMNSGVEGNPGSAGNISLLLNEGNGVFTRTDLEVGVNTTSIDVDDLDGDGDVDLVIVAEADGQRSVRVLRNELLSVGELNFTVVADLAPDPSLELVLTRRLNDDASPDLIVIDGDDEEGEGSVLVLLSFVCSADFDNNGDVDTLDLIRLLSAWGPCPKEGDCPEDLDGDGNVDTLDLILLLSTWGPCAS